MKAVVLVEYGQSLQMCELPIPIPVPEQGEVLVKLEACGVCHSDINFWNGEHTLPGELPQVMGHEGIGRVVKLGSPGSRFKEGDRVGVGYTTTLVTNAVNV